MIGQHFCRSGRDWSRVSAEAGRIGQEVLEEHMGVGLKTVLHLPLLFKKTDSDFICLRGSKF